MRRGGKVATKRPIEPPEFDVPSSASPRDGEITITTGGFINSRKRHQTVKSKLFYVQKQFQLTLHWYHLLLCSIDSVVFKSRSLGAKVTVAKVPKTRQNILLLVHTSVNLCGDDTNPRERRSDARDALGACHQVDEDDPECGESGQTPFPNHAVDPHLSSATPFSKRTLIAWIAEPPVASMGSRRKTYRCNGR